MIKKEDVFKIGQFAKPHGIKGEIALVTNSDVFEDSDDPYIICEMDGILVPFFIEEYRYKTDTVILLKLKNVNDEKAAREFSNREVFYSLDEVDEDDLVGDMTWDSFIGYRVIDEHHGEIGEITDVDESTINVLLQIDHNGEELLLPAAEELILSADHENKTLTVSIPEGLLDYEIDEYTWHKSKDEQIRNHSGTGLGLNINCLSSMKERWRKYGLSGCRSFLRLRCWLCLLSC